MLYQQLLKQHDCSQLLSFVHTLIYIEGSGIITKRFVILFLNMKLTFYFIAIKYARRNSYQPIIIIYVCIHSMFCQSICCAEQLIRIFDIYNFKHFLWNLCGGGGRTRELEPKSEPEHQCSNLPCLAFCCKHWQAFCPPCHQLLQSLRWCWLLLCSKAGSFAPILSFVLAVRFFSLAIILQVGWRRTVLVQTWQTKN